jgi:hypothetical protein
MHKMCVDGYKHVCVNIYVEKLYIYISI